MKFMNQNKKRISLILAVMTVLTISIGALAYFTDRVTANATITSVDASDIIKVSTKDDGTIPEDPKDYDPSGDLEKKWDSANTDEEVNPGESYDLGYKLTNKGEKIFVRETIILTITDSNGQAKNVSSSSPEWRLFSAFSTDEYGAKTGTTIVSAEKISNNQIKYEVAPFTLDAGASVNKAYYAILDKYASNAWQGSNCKVEYLVEMAQYADAAKENLDTYAEWSTICTADISFGGSNAYKAVPAAN